MAIETIDLGDQVICDDCGVYYTARDDCGGILFVSRACCPACAPKVEALAAKYNEKCHIRARCPESMTFADWVRTILRGGQPGQIRVLTGDDVFQSEPR